MSSISAVSGLGPIYDTAQTNSSQGNNPFSEFEQLASSLQSGNLFGRATGLQLTRLDDTKCVEQ